MFSVLPAVQEDVTACVFLEEKYFSEPWSHLSFLNAVSDKDTLFYVAKYNSVVIGYFVAGRICDEINLYTIAVDENYRQQGFGNSLIEELIKCAVALHACAIYLEVRTSNTPAIRLYERYGFQQIGMRKDFYRKPTEDALLFALYLPKEENL